MEIISRKLSEMPSLIKVKFDQLWTHKKSYYAVTHNIKFNDKTPEEAMDP